MSIRKTGTVFAFMETVMEERDACLEGTMEAEKKMSVGLDLDGLEDERKTNYESRGQKRVESGK